MDTLEALRTVSRFMESAPVDVRGLALELGLRVREEALPADISGKIFCPPGESCVVVVNEAHSITRKRFTIAHEIAHFILHRDLIGDGITDNALYRSTLTDAIERQASRYAANILMPWPIVISHVDAGSGEKDKLAKAFNVSPAVAEIRLRELEMLRRRPVAST